MAVHRNEVVIDYPSNKIFNVFVKSIKRDFPKFKESNAIGSSIKKTVGSYSNKKATMTVEITDFKRDSLYEIQTSGGAKVYTSRYELHPIDENSTKLILIESENSTGIFSILNAFITKLLYKKTLKHRFDLLVKNLVDEIEK